jgi:hypothetical protein
MTELAMKYEIVGGRVYGQDRISGAHQSVALRDVALAMAKRGGYEFHPDELEVLDNLGTLGWSFGGAFKKAFKKVSKVLRPIVKVAKSVVHNKVFNMVMGVAGVAIPAPFGTVLLVAEAGIQAANKIASTVKDKAQKAKIGKAVALLADKKVAPSRAGELAKATGVSPASLKAMALASQLQKSAKKGDKKAATILKIGKIARTGTEKEAEALKKQLLDHVAKDKAKKAASAPSAAHKTASASKTTASASSAKTTASASSAKTAAAHKVASAVRPAASTAHKLTSSAARPTTIHQPTAQKTTSSAHPAAKTASASTAKTTGKTHEQIIQARSGRRYKIAVSQVV